MENADQVNERARARARRAVGGAWLCTYSGTHSCSHAAVVFIQFEKGLRQGNVLQQLALHFMFGTPWHLVD